MNFKPRILLILNIRVIWLFTLTQTLSAEPCILCVSFRLFLSLQQKLQQNIQTWSFCIFPKTNLQPSSSCQVPGFWGLSKKPCRHCLMACSRVPYWKPIILCHWINLKSQNVHYFLKFVSINQSYKLCTKSARIQCLDGSSWLTVSNQIVKSLSLSYKKFYFFNMVQPIDLIFAGWWKLLNRTFLIVQIFYLGPNFLFLAKSIFSADEVTRIKSGNPI